MSILSSTYTVLINVINFASFIISITMYNHRIADVVQGMNYGLLHVPETVSFPPYARFAAILAAAVHDVGHLGM